MASRNQNRPPRSPATKKDNMDEVPLDKRRKIGTARFGAPSGMTSTEGPECGTIEFTKEEVEALLNEKIKAKKFDTKGKMEQMDGHIKKLKLCIKWFQQHEEGQLVEQGKLQNALECAEKKCADTELEMKNKEEELNVIIEELRKSIASLQDKLVKEESEKLDAMDSYTREKEARDAVEKVKASLSEELAKTQQEKLNANQKASQDEAVKQRELLGNEVQCLRGELQQVRDDRDRQVMQVHALATEVEKYKESTGKSFVELDNLTVKSNALEETCSSQREQLRILQHQLAAANEKLKMVDLSASETRTEFELQKGVISELQDRLADAELRIIEGENLRKKLHNTILELKGNIRVFCRVRPLLPEDGAGSESSVVSFPTSTEALGRGIDLTQNGQIYPFTFDKVFAHGASQQDVFVEISQLVQSALDGYKVCIFAYGQTGSGKTYTMMGRPEASDEKGLIPRSLEQIFQTSQSLLAQGWRYKMQASMLEIYNETIRDLLSTSRSGGLDVTRTENGVGGKQYAIKHDVNGNTHVSDLTIVDVSSMKEISSLLQQAAHCRSVGRTQMNEQSSRSHLVFTLRISGVNESTEQQVQGVLNLIDLAGSERLSKSMSTGDRLKETQAINKSLSSLSDVILALARKDDHVPYRNSKLTYLLQPCLGGDSKTLMFVNISPDPSSVGESLCSLRFAAKVNACEIGIPRRQTTMRISDSRLSYG
ncbi:Kinesin-like protein KIN-14C [Vitis vinifera]|uniref:Kinesin-like protein n=1 Tax=Vitis vinifera TaxID=29760 RepID=A0A438HPM6_VITVI|nr:Kinesin-like protein KIN-14C [Vitis vinifera]